MGLDHTNTRDVELPEKHREDWFIRQYQDTITNSMVLYHTERDKFYSLFEVNKFTVYMRELSTFTQETANKQDIEDGLFETWIPVEVRA